MKMKDKILAGLVIAVLIMAVVVTFSVVRYGKAKAVWDYKVKEALAQCDVLSAKSAEISALAAVYEEEADKYKGFVGEAKQRLLEEEKAHIATMEKLEYLEPTEVVLETRAVLDVDNAGILLTELGVQFSIAAARGNLAALHRLDFCLDIKIPELEHIIEIEGKEAEKLRASIQKLEDQTVILGDKSDEWEELYRGERKLRLMAQRSFSLFSTRNLVIGGVVVGILVGGFVLLSK